MKVSMLSDGLATSTLVRLVRECIQFDVAVAWAGPNTAVDAMLEAHPKLGRVVIGTHMYQTDPAVLRRFMPHKGAHCLLPDGRLFHPKVKFCGNRKRQSQESCRQCPSWKTNFGVSTQQVACCEVDDCRHDRHLSQFRPTLSDSGNKKWNPEHAEDEPGTQHDGEVEEACSDSL